MTRPEVARALITATTQAFRSGVRHGRHRGSEAEAMAAAIQYAEMLVLPVVDLALDQAAEAATIAAMAARQDPEPPDHV